MTHIVGDIIYLTDDCASVGYLASRAGTNCVYLGTGAGQNRVGAGIGDVLVGAYAGAMGTAVLGSTCIGFEAGYYETEVGNVFVGYQAGKGTVLGVGKQHTCLGYQSGTALRAGSINNTFAGYWSGKGVTTGSRNTFMGSECGKTLWSGSDNTFLGKSAGALASTGSRNTAIGFQAYGSLATASGNDNVFIGWNCGSNVTNCSNVVAIGQSAAINYSIPMNGSVVIGVEAAPSSCNAPIVAIGYQACYTMSTPLGSNGHCVAVGHQSQYYNSGAYTVTIGYKAMYGDGDPAGGPLYTAFTNTVAIGDSAMEHGRRCINSVAIGYQALYLAGYGAVSPNAHVAIGNYAMVGIVGVANVTGVNVVAIGFEAAKTATTCQSSVFVGHQSRSIVVHTTNGCTYIGHSTGQNNAADNGTFVGWHAGIRATALIFSVLIGYMAGEGLTTGNSMTAIGHGAVSAEGAVTSTASNAVIVGHNAGKGAVTITTSTLIGNNCGYKTGGGPTFSSCIWVGHSTNPHATLLTCNNSVIVGNDCCLVATNAGNNTIIGHQSGTTLTSGTSNVLLGYNNQAASAISNSIVIGSSCSATADQMCIFGGPNLRAASIVESAVGHVFKHTSTAIGDLGGATHNLTVAEIRGGIITVTPNVVGLDTYDFMDPATMMGCFLGTATNPGKMNDNTIFVTFVNPTANSALFSVVAFTHHLSSNTLNAYSARRIGLRIIDATVPSMEIFG